MSTKLRFKVTKFNELTEDQCGATIRRFIKPFVITQRKIKKDLRSIVNAILLITRTGYQLQFFVGAANIVDSVAGLELLPKFTNTTQILQIIRADNAYKKDFAIAASYFDYEVEVKQRLETAKGFVPETGRWQVERTFAWWVAAQLVFYRRLSKDYEKTTQSAISFIQLAFIGMILAKF